MYGPAARLLLILFALLACPSVGQEAELTVGLIPVTVEGDYRPLDSEQATSMLYQGLLAGKSRAKLVLLKRQDNVQTVQQALQVGKQENLDLIIWGSVRFRKDATPDMSPDPFYRGRLEIQVATEAALMVAWVPEDKLVLTQPTLVVSSQKTLSWVTDDTRNLSVEQSIAANSIREAADSLVHVVRRRKQDGWFQQH